jgi:site-specific DNA recombinase
MCATRPWKRSSPNCSGGWVLEWVRDALHASHADERRDHEEAIKAEYKRLQDRIHAMYVDKLDGVVETAFFEKMSKQWREEQNRCLREIERHQEADKCYMDEGVQLLELARNVTEPLLNGLGGKFHAAVGLPVDQP